MNNLNILSIETSSKNSSVSISQNNDIVSYQEINVKKSHSEKIIELIDGTLKNSTIEQKDLSHIAVSIGPGSFTGIRIGISAAQGISLALNIPIIPILTLESIAFDASNFNYDNLDMIPMIDAGRMEVYTAIYSSNLTEIKKPHPIILDDPLKFDEFYKKKALIFGYGSEKFKNLSINPNIYFLDNIYPNSINIARLAYKKLNSDKNILSTNSIVHPFYIKPARINQKKRIMDK